MEDKNSEREEKIGRAAAWISWIWFAFKFILAGSLIALIICYFLGKPLWIAPLIGVGAFLIFRIGWRILWLIFGWAAKQ
ncbi:MAG: hypothetical protein K6F53_10065 [Lachnospiraceae bacterium]|nr:hypothetical protein [Lachnospiraceae bacterium]